MKPTKVMDHGAYRAQLKRKSIPELLFIIRDANQAIEANPDGPNAGYYADEVHYAATEWKFRKPVGIIGTKAPKHERI